MRVLEQVQNHQIYLTNLPLCIGAIREIEQDEETLSKISDYAHEVLNRLKLITSQLNFRLNAIDPYLLRLDILNSLNTSISNVTTNLKNYKSTLFDENNLNNINNQINNLIANLVQIPTINSTEDVTILKESLTSFRHSMSAQKGELTKLLNELLQEKKQSTQDFIQLKENFTTLENQYNDLNESLNQKIEDIELGYQTLVDETKGEFEEIKLNNKESIVNKIKELDEQYVELESNNSNFIDEQTEIFGNEFIQFKTELVEKQNAYNQMLEEHKKSVEDLLGIISTNTISGHFKSVADIRAKNSVNWKRITFSSFVTTIGFGMFAFMFSISEGPYDIISRIIVTSALGAFTAYSANQVNKYEKQENFNRQMEVELKTLNPYIASFNVEDQIKLKEQLFPQIFGKSNRSFEVEENAKLNVNSPEVYELLIQFLEKIKVDTKK